MIKFSNSNEPPPELKPRAEAGSKSPARYSYTAANANEWRGLFDDMIEKGGDRMVYAEIVGRRPSTLNTLCNDALRWLVDHEGGKYAALRASVCVRMTEDGVKIYFRRSITTILASVAENKEQPIAPAPPPEAKVEWQEQFTQWLGVAQPGDVFDSAKVIPAGIKMTAENKQWLLQLLAGLEGVELDIQEGGFKVMR